MESHINSFYQNADKFLVAVDCIIFGFEKQRLKLLLFKRSIEPFKNEWSLIGSFVKDKEAVSAAAKRVLVESTGLQNIYMDELGCYGNINRDSGARVISIAHYALIRIQEQEKQLIEKFHANWFDVDEIPPLILDHNEMVTDALEKLRIKVKHEPLVFELLSKEFTIPQLKSLYDGIYQKELDKRNFRKKVLSMGILKKLEEKDKSTSKKGAYLYRIDSEKYEALLKKGFRFEL